MLTQEVSTATLHKQTLRDAPASVTVVTAEEIERYGFRTLGEVLSNVRSFYMTSDGPARFAGVRGYSLPGDFNTRFIVMIDGHHLTDNVYGAMYYFGQDFPLELSHVSQIEIVRGPSSALYGSNGLFATVNIITRRPASASRVRLSTEYGSDVGKSFISVSGEAGPGLEWQVSASALYSGGRVATFPAGQLGPNPVKVAGVESEAGYHTFARIAWRHWTFTTVFGQHRATAPHGWYGSAVADTGTTDLEARNFVEASWNRAAGAAAEIRWTGYYDQYRYDGVYVYDTPEAHREFDGALGDRVGSQIVYRRSAGPYEGFTAGAEMGIDLRNLQYNYNVAGAGAIRRRVERFHLNRPSGSYGLFAQQELEISPSWTAYIGGRIDDSSAGSPFISPRAALVRKRKGTTYKALYGRAFRNPSTYERYWEPNPLLNAERMHTYELVREQNIRHRLNLVTSVFHYRLSGLIEGVPVNEIMLQYRNISRASATGIEAEVSGSVLNWLDSTAGFSLQRTRGANNGQKLPNSPARLALFRASAPFAWQRLTAAVAVRYVGARLGGGSLLVPGYSLVDVTLTAPRLGGGLDLQAGIRNLLGAMFSDPLSPEHTPHTLPGRGRSVFIRMTWRDE